MSLALPAAKPAMIASLRGASPLFFMLTLLFLAGFTACLALGIADGRLINGVSVWEKPGKFFLSLGVHAATLGWGVALLPDDLQKSRGIRRASALFAIASIGEMIWISLQAANGTASHFNQADTLHQVMYALMGVGAVTLTAVTGYVGWRIFKAGNTVLAHAAGAGFILSGILTTLVAGYMSQLTGHSIGGDPSDATGLAFFHWSTTGGDLRVPHFAALHVAQALPFVAWVWPDRRIVTLGSLVSVAVVAALFLQALAGIPFLRP